MIVYDLDGNKTSWHLTGNITKTRNNNKSELHLLARKILHEIYPTLQILEEVPINPKKGTTLYLDFYLPLIKKCIEIHGEQHYKFIPFYHQNMMGFVKSKKRDEDKKNWCEINSIRYVSLSFDSTETWKDTISNE